MENSNDILDRDNIAVENSPGSENIISSGKFIILSIFTLGLYDVWWAYKAWRFFKQKEKSDIMPAMRALFSIFFLYSLFSKILEFAKEKEYNESYSPGWLFAGFIFANLLSRLPEPFGMISVFSFIFLIPPFNALNYAKQNSTELVVNEQHSFNGRQIALLICGIILWGLILIGLTMEV